MSEQRSARHSAPGDHLHVRQIVKAVSSVIAALLSVAILVAFAYGWKYYGDLNSGVHKLTINSLGKKPKPAAGVVQHVDGKDQNILITGLDDRSGLTAEQIKQFHTGSDVSSSTDSIMVIHVPSDGSKATLISIPRDSIVDIPNYLENKINAAYADGAIVGGSGTPDQRRAEGIDQLVTTVSQLTGLTIDHFVEVGFSGFVNISNAIDGIQINLCYAQDDPYSGLHLSAGSHTIYGATALAFVRQRHNITGGNGDLSRVERQRYFLTQAFKRIESLGVLASPGKLSKLIAAVKGAVYIDEHFSLTSLAEQMINLSAGNITGYTIPTQGSLTIRAGTSRAVSGLKVDPAQVQTYIQKILYPPKPTTPPSSSSSSSPSGSTTPTNSSSSPSTLPKGCIH